MRITQTKLESFPANCNPFHYDEYNMGMRISKNHYMMMGNHASEDMKYFIIVDLNTGDRIEFKIED